MTTQENGAVRRSWHARAHKAHEVFTSIYIDMPDDLARFAAAEAHVTVTEDPEGEYRGWLKTGHEGEPPVLIQHTNFFGMQFVYGVQAEIDRGMGSVVHLAVSADEAAIGG
ncbi:hypothetical protein [Mycobacteroides abscessus]|uniref:hypothetical protein n=1 Tax=Mycobacteroides abscessus TaxID=36809 RepID=UPI000C25D272|nr:hypothetical protein [Mycobacteroides abscessus]